MFLCTVCSDGVQFGNGQTFLAHYQFFHSKEIASGVMVCKHSECIGRKFNKLNSFRKHVLSHKGSSHLPSEHTDTYGSVCDQGNVEEFQSENIGEPPPVLINNLHDDHFSSVKESVKFDEAITKSVVSFIASLYDCGSFTDSQIQFVIDSHKQLLGSGFLSVLKSEVVTLLSEVSRSGDVSESDVKNVSRMFDSCQNLFEGFETSHLRTSELENSGAYIPPQEFTIGPAQNEVNQNGFVVIEPIKLTGQFIPFRHVLKGFLELPGVLKEILGYVSHLEVSYAESGPIENFLQGELWRKTIKPKFGDKCVLPLSFSFDDYESNKELGYHTGVHKLGAGYIRLMCLPPKFASLLENIFLAVLIHSGDRVKGNKKTFRKVISELKYLEEFGIRVCTPEGIIQVYFTLGLVTGDNLGVNGILGFVECFSANYYCRICSVHKSVAMKQTEANPALKKSKESYARDLCLNDSSLTGRKGECIFNELQGFHVSENNYLDTMHDMDEGVMKYVMYHVLKYLCVKKRFTVEYLNDAIQAFYYGTGEEKNKIGYISHDDLYVNKKIRGSASEMKCLVRYFGLMVGHLIQLEDMDVWSVYLKLRKIVDIISAPIVRKEDSILLKQLVKEHHSEYQRVFRVHLQPKFHLMLHQDEVMLQNGPLEPISSYRTEHKHGEGKSIAYKSKNRIKLPLTVAKQHQMKFAYRLLCGRGFVQKFQYNAVQSLRVQYLENFSEFCSILPPDHCDILNTTKSLEVNGAKYCVGSVVLHSLTTSNTPVFGQVKLICIHPGDVGHLFLKTLDVIKFDEHVHAWEVTSGEKCLFVDVKSLLSYVSTDVRRTLNEKLYVPFRFDVKCFRN